MLESSATSLAGILHLVTKPMRSVSGDHGELFYRPGWETLAMFDQQLGTASSLVQNVLVGDETADFRPGQWGALLPHGVQSLLGAVAYGSTDRLG